MRNILSVLAAAGILLAAAAAFAQTGVDGTLPPSLPSGDGYVQYFDTGHINWQEGRAVAIGIGAPPAAASNPAQARAMAVRAATVVARRNLLELIKGVSIDATTTVNNYMTADDTVVSQVRGYLQNTRVLDTAYMSDGSVEVTVGIGLRGDFADVIIPKTTPFGSKEPPQIGQPVEGVAYTGLVVDARGLEAKPAMTPRIVDEEGEVIYGAAYVDRKFAVEQGMAGYAKDLKAAAANARVGDRPYLVKAVRAEGPAQTDLVIKTEDAQALKSMSGTLTFLEQCRVMIVLD